jgi:hypothetical protein
MKEEIGLDERLFEKTWPLNSASFIAFSGPGASNASKAAGTTWPWNESWSKGFSAWEIRIPEMTKSHGIRSMWMSRSWMSIVSDVLSLIEVNCRFSLEL